MTALFESDMEIIMQEAKSIAVIIDNAVDSYLEKYPEPIKKPFLRSHLNQPQARELKKLAMIFASAHHHLTKQELLKFLSKIYSIVDNLSEDSLKTDISEKSNMDEHTIKIIAKMIGDTPQQVTTLVALENSGIGGKSIKGYLRYAATVIQEENISQETLKL